jgi:hypothetical protein
MATRIGGPAGPSTTSVTRSALGAQTDGVTAFTSPSLVALMPLVSYPGAADRTPATPSRVLGGQAGAGDERAISTSCG